MTKKVIGIDIGGTSVRVGLIDENLNLLSKEVANTSDFSSQNDLFHAIKEMIQKVDSAGETSKIGICLPIPWTPDLEEIVDAINISYLDTVKISEIKNYFKEYEVYIENDMNVIAILEANLGSSKEYKHSLYVTVSTGIASGVIINREIFHGTNGYGGEVGNIQLTDSHGNFSEGTLENLCSGLALEQKSKQLFGEEADARLLFEKFHEGNELAEEAVDDWIEYFSSGMASIIHCFDPEIIILGGSVIMNNEWLIEKVVEETKEKVFPNLVNKVNIVISKFGNDVGILGAGFLAIKNTKGD